MGAHPSKMAKEFEADQIKTPISIDPESLVLRNTAEGAGSLSDKSIRTTVHIDALRAKVWNPNNPESWDADMREYHTVENSEYALPSDEIEQNRLEIQHYIYRAGFKGDIICPAAKELVQQPDTKILDVGCAKGFWLNCVKKGNPNPLVEYHGVDIAQNLVSESSSKNGINIQFGNVLEHEDSTFDYVHQRLVYFGLPKEKFSDAFRELIRVTKPGGWVEIVEADIIIYNAGPCSKHWGKAMFNAMHERGLDCYAATNLPFYLSQVEKSISNSGVETVHFPFSGDTRLGKLNGGNGKAGILALEDYMHKTMGMTRQEYRELAENCFVEWNEHNSQQVYRVKLENFVGKF
ncbi:hypothetical protein HK100_006818 [Physocladia obscura]|uniref:Methyltransferase domain-containing protein n=1 Tax=Physocladia obscura TaxID=109957 RepID=A0AAD5SVP0_9FUNG|nr:hypothetical protein HK100_006818 [Physocladia obscura]